MKFLTQSASFQEICGT